MTLAITQPIPNALPGRRYGSFRRPFFVPKVFQLVAMRVSMWTITADKQLLFVLVADHPGTFVLEV